MPPRANSQTGTQAAYLYSLFERKAKKITPEGKFYGEYARLRDYEKNRIQNFGGMDKLIDVPSHTYAKSLYKEEVRNFVTVHRILWHFLRLEKHCDGKLAWVSIESSKRIVCEVIDSFLEKEDKKTDQDRARSEMDSGFISPDFGSDGRSKSSKILPYRTKKDIDDAWSKYKSVSHIIFGIVQAASIDGPSMENAKINIIDSLCSAIYAQEKLTTTIIRNTKKPSLGEDAIWKLPPLIGVRPKEPKLPELRPEDIDASTRRSGSKGQAGVTTASS